MEEQVKRDEQVKLEMIEGILRVNCPTAKDGRTMARLNTNVAASGLNLLRTQFDGGAQNSHLRNSPNWLLRGRGRGRVLVTGLNKRRPNLSHWKVVVAGERERKCGKERRCVRERECERGGEEREGQQTLFLSFLMVPTGGGGEEERGGEGVSERGEESEFGFKSSWMTEKAQAQNQTQNNSCPNKFKCGSLGNVSFPFSISSQPACGLYTIDCDVTPNPEIHLGENVYTALNQRLFDNSFQVLDLRLSDVLAKNSCQSFDRSLSFPSSPSISFRINESNITLFKCKDSLDINRSTNDHYFRDYQKYSRCSGFRIYYKHPSSGGRKGSSDVPEGHIPDNCSLIQLPITWGRSNTENSSLFDLFTAKFKLQWSLSDDCNQCHYQGGRCLTERNKKFHCSSNPTVQYACFIESYLDGEKKREDYRNVKAFLKNHGSLAPRKYSYSEPLLGRLTPLLTDPLVGQLSTSFMALKLPLQPSFKGHYSLLPKTIYPRLANDFDLTSALCITASVSAFNLSLVSKTFLPTTSSLYMKESTSSSAATSSPLSPLYSILNCLNTKKKLLDIETRKLTFPRFPHWGQNKFNSRWKEQYQNVTAYFIV
ncbi:hypothetical protein RND71_008700 [Anisodus tanguticus]|uniref:Uncharacterized protein n=1 Tax=Anisodus tanguticus TaxID=243964 RepID=A0AAE1VQY9_9SOLA|nr:hypothetical protein RND71_008700 [Anisodus tanguticus]